MPLPNLEKYLYRGLTIVAIAFILAAPTRFVVGLYLLAATVAHIELILNQSTRPHFILGALAWNIVLIGLDHVIKLPLPLACFLAVGNSVLLASCLSKHSVHTYNTRLIIGTVAMTSIAMSADKSLHLPLSAHLSSLQECLLLVAMQDFAAAFAGKRLPLGRFAPAISPNKTWAGVLAGFAGGLSAWIALRSTIGTNFGLLQMSIILVAGVFGDLFFSSVKRAMEIKDFSRVLRYKGGMLDRIDSSIFAILVASWLPT